ncbi:hypothetical protein [Kitasatospora purpeofusca]|uniref:hypothetical protein n=1 Tax=Kitasatospora purpeofusca TaxID=67352 RepID=UPI002A59D9BB|nr:hypothetical protein [Kitasatospora purpeofusca]MDY0809986.1 hypothetical protein [Kitasatospora purpeofusca]
MLVETLTTLAAAGGGAVAQAAGTDAWHGVRRRVAELFGRGDEQREQAELERLDRTSLALEPGAAAERDRQAGLWQGRFETLLENARPLDQERLADELRALLTFAAGFAGDLAVSTGKATATDGGHAVTGVERTDEVGGRPARAVNTGDAQATGPGSRAVSGVSGVSGVTDAQHGPRGA